MDSSTKVRLPSHNVVLGMFYMIVAEGTLIDWWIISRETVFFLLYLVVMSWLLYGNQIEMSAASILFFLYILHVYLMNYSKKYEEVLKQLLARRMETRELNRLAKSNQLWRFHLNLKSQAISIEMLNKIEFSVINGYIVFADTMIKYKM